MADKEIEAELGGTKLAAQLLAAIAEVELYTQGKLDLPSIDVPPGQPFSQNTKAEIKALFDHAVTLGNTPE